MAPTTIRYMKGALGIVVFTAPAVVGAEFVPHMAAFSTDRLVHAGVAAGFLVIALLLRLGKKYLPDKVSEWIPALCALYLGSWIPDWDLIAGIGFHRSPVTHSVLPLLIFAWGTGFEPRLVFPFALGLASHLFWDIVFFGNLTWISGRGADMAWLWANLLLTLVAGLILSRQRRVETGV